MSNVHFCSDLHFGHVNIGKFRKEVGTEAANTERISKDWNSVVRKRDTVFVLGDAAFTEEGLSNLDKLPGIKYLIRGNHDLLPTQDYLKVFKEVYGIVKYKGYWLSHAPIHPNELRGKVNLHGHVHYHTIKLDDGITSDERYLNCCPENLWAITGDSLINLDYVRKIRPK